MDYLMGIDLGSTSLKAVIYDLDGNMIATGSRPTQLTHPDDHPEWAVWQPEHIWGDMAAAIRDAVSALDDPRQLKAVAVTGMGMDGVPIDESGQWLYPLISWHDPRTGPQLDWWKENIGAEKTFATAGNTLWHICTALRLRWMAEHGFAAASISYRFAPEHRWPAQIEDARAALRFLRGNADKYHIDPDRIGALGLSAGAHLAMMLGVTEDDADAPDVPETSAEVGAVVSFVGPTDLAAEDLPPYSERLVRELLGVPREGNLDRYRAASPLTHVSADDPPMLLFCGTTDRLIPVDQGFRMAEAMTRAGVPGRVEFIVGAGHGWPGDELDRTLEASLAFFRRHLTSKPAADDGNSLPAPTSPGR